MHACVCLSVCLSACMAAWPSVCPSVCLFDCMPVSISSLILYHPYSSVRLPSTQENLHTPTGTPLDQVLTISGPLGHPSSPSSPVPSPILLVAAAKFV